MAWRKNGYLEDLLDYTLPTFAMYSQAWLESYSIFRDIQCFPAMNPYSMYVLKKNRRPWNLILKTGKRYRALQGDFYRVIWHKNWNDIPYARPYKPRFIIFQATFLDWISFKKQHKTCLYIYYILNRDNLWQYGTPFMTF